MIKALTESLSLLKKLNPRHEIVESEIRTRNHRLQKVLVANRGEIAKRFFLSLKEEGIPSVAIVTDADIGQSWYDQADEVVVIGDIRNYTNIPVVIAAAMLVQANAIYPGYGFLSEEAEFVKAIKEASKAFQTEIIFMGPDSDIMERVGSKLAARKLAKEQGVPLFEGSEAVPDAEKARIVANQIGYPVIIKLTAGGGGKGMMPVHSESGMYLAVEYCQRTGRNLYNNDTFYLEKFIEKPVHMEVQIFNGMAIGIRKCAVQRRNQKVIEESGDYFLDSHTTLSMLAAAENMARISGYANGAGAGTVEFLFDPDSQKFGFLEMNVRLQVEHPVTDQSVGIDLAKWQILYFDGRESEIPFHLALQRRFVGKMHSIEARIYAEDPESEYSPAPGVIQELELPTYNGLRCDFGFKKGDTILPHYDPMIGKVIVEGTTRAEAITRLERALSELYVKGVLTNINQLLNIVRHKEFKEGVYTNRLLSDYRDLEGGKAEESESRLAAIFGSLGENARYIQEAAAEAFISKDIENTLQVLRIKKLPSSFTVKIYSHSFEIQLVQNSLDLFLIFVDDEYFGEMELLPRIEGSDDYLVRFGTHYYPIRIDRKPSFTLVRMPDDDGKIHFYKLNIIPHGAGEKVDPQGMMRAPFQSTFVGFAKDEHLKRNRLTEGSIVKKGDPIIIISAMKMETTLFAPVDGKISYLCENGDLSRLEIGRTPEGLVIGKSISEGEVLFIVESGDEKNAAESDTAKKKIKAKGKKNSHPLSILYDDEIVDAINKKPKEILPILFKMARSHFQGFLSDDKIIKRISDIIKSLPDTVYAKCDSEEIQNEIDSIISFYTNIKKMYSPALETNLSYFGELSKFVSMWDDDTYRPSYGFRMSLGQLFKAYAITDWTSKSVRDNVRLKLAFFTMMRAHGASVGQSEVIKQLIDILSRMDKPSNKTINVLKNLILQDQAERDDSLAVYTRRLLKNFDVPQGNREAIPVISRKYIPLYRSHVNDIYASFEGKLKPEEIQKKMEESLKGVASASATSSAPAWFQKEYKILMEAIKGKYEHISLFSPYDDIYILKISDKSAKKEHYLVAAMVEVVDLDKDENGAIMGSNHTEMACIRATQVIRAYQKILPLSDNWIEVYATKDPILLDFGNNDNFVLNYNVFARTGISVLRFFLDLSITRTTLHIDAKNPFTSGISRKKLLLGRQGGRLNLDLIIENDGRNPLFKGEIDQKSQRLFDRDKWPIDVWVNEVYDPESGKEITIDSIDKKVFIDSKGKEAFKPVGGRIYMGKIAGKETLFYMKDSRISGGASGDLEGLKYVAATYIAYKKNLPLYVWNDGAGANIKEGMVSLNRAAQGFMMNALLAGRVSSEEMKQYTIYNPDQVLRELFYEIDTKVNPGLQNLKGGSKFFLIAVGIGSSTGLDVYGSSQMAIQVMVDSDQSYRVLTGSNVIKSVTGEDLTNYEIGGARVMGSWTGTADIIAQNKLHLISIVRSIQDIFVHDSGEQKIKRLPMGESDKKVSAEKMDVINYKIIRENIDNGYYIPMKEEFYGSGSAVGGFARLAGKSVLILGPRTDFGMRSFPSITKAKELMAIARKTGIPQILVFGSKWYRETITEDDLALRARMDFSKILSEKNGTRINIVTHPDGLHIVPLNSLADVIIYVKQSELTTLEYDVVRKTAMFIVENMEEAFNLSSRLIQLFDERKVEKISVSKKEPVIPEDTTVPFDIIKNIIEPAFDENSFVEFYEKMNDSTQGPSLITAIARLNGETVGIIADQPAIMGGAPDAPGTEKFRFFTELLSRNNLPLVMLSNAPGFIPGTKQERLRIQQIGGESLDVNVLSNIPVVSVVLNQNYGGRQIHAFSRFLRPGIVYIALKRSIMAVMGATASFDLFKGSEYQALIKEGKSVDAQALKNDYISDYNQKAAAANDAFASGVLDWTFDHIKELRENLIKALGKAKTLVVNIFGNKTYMEDTKGDEIVLYLSRLLLAKNIFHVIDEDGNIVLHNGEKIKPDNIEKFAEILK